jgi:hypothetical protein
MPASIAAEFLLVRKRSGTWILLGVWAALSAFFGYLLPYMTSKANVIGPVRAQSRNCFRRHWS